MVRLGRADIRLCNVESSAPVGGEHVELATTREAAVLHPVGARRGPDLAGVCGRRIFRWRALATTGLPFAATRIIDNAAWVAKFPPAPSEWSGTIPGKRRGLATRENA